MSLLRKETAHAINGVPGRLMTLHIPPAPWKAGTFANQTWVSEARSIAGWGKGATLRVDMRFDDNCRNGYNNFAITAEIRRPGARDVEACGCLHDEISQVFPELAPLTQWHLMGTDSPMHYVANTVYHASDRDSSGRAAGEPSAFEYGYQFNDSPIVTRVKKSFFDWIEARRAFNSGTPKNNPAHGEFQVVALAYVDRPGNSYNFAPKYTFNGFGETWYHCPFDDKASADEFAQAMNTCSVKPLRIATAFSEGKKRDFDAARNAGLWPDATDAELSVDKETLTAALNARLPALVAAFRAAMESAGFVWQAPI